MLRLYVELSEKIRKLAADVSGATAIEYGLIAALVATVLIVALTLLGNQLAGLFNDLASAIIDVERCTEVDSNCKK